MVDEAVAGSGDDLRFDHVREGREDVKARLAPDLRKRVVLSQGGRNLVDFAFHLFEDGRTRRRKMFPLQDPGKVDETKMRKSQPFSQR